MKSFFLEIVEAIEMHKIGNSAILTVFIVLGMQACTKNKEAEALAIRGQDLRMAIVQEYGELKSSHRLTFEPSNIDGIIGKYIPPGTSFADAEKILKAAGFTLRPALPESRPDGDGNSGIYFDVLADLTLERGFVMGTSAGVLLTVDQPGPSPKTVKHALGNIATTSL
jgi:hypothetical protein